VFIALEGGEGSGKSTQAARLANRLGAVLTREPGGTQLGEQLRDLLLARGSDVHPRAEALLMAAARAQHVAEVIAPALAAGRDVVTDRFTGSSLAYQGFARGLGVGEVDALSRFATDGVDPEVTVLLVVSEQTARARRAGTEPDRIESAGDDFHRLVAQGYAALAKEDEHWVVVDGDGAVDEVEARVWGALRGMLALDG
jgi:dTMP kinase